MGSLILSVEDLQVTLGGNPVLRDVSFVIRAKEQWAVFGEAGSGKTVLAYTLAGHHAYQGRIICEQVDVNGNPALIVVGQQHRFKDLQNQSQFYYQQRYNSFDAEATMTLGQDLDLIQPSHSPVLSKKELLNLFQLDLLLEEPLIQLSNGENKRLQIVKAVLQSRGLLVLDEPFTGLDKAGRGLLDDMLTVLAEAGQTLMLLSSRDHIPKCFNRFARLEKGSFQSKKNPEEIRIAQSEPRSVRQKHFPAAIPTDFPAFRYALRMHQVQVRYGDKQVLEGINWEVEKGSRWALTGPNGAGKSTLLSLITADHPQAYANEIYLFDRRRGSGESIWDIKQKIGFLSPELHLYFDPAATAFSAIASGLFDTIGLFRRLNPQQEEKVAEWLDFLDCTDYTHRPLSSLPLGIQRLILLARAIIKSPPLLILDEPCQGLDKGQTRDTLKLIDQYCESQGAGLIYVSHYQEDFPGCIRHHLKLAAGRIS